VLRLDLPPRCICRVTRFARSLRSRYNPIPTLTLNEQLSFSVIWLNMDAILHEIRRGDDGLIQLRVSLGSREPRIFRATYDDADAPYIYCNVEQELFMALSDMAFLRFGNCVVYQFELMSLIGAFCRGMTLPDLPASLGTTSFCTLKPSRTQVAWNKFRIFLRRLGLYRRHNYIVPAELASQITKRSNGTASR
jgi:hypothetical protein